MAPITVMGAIFISFTAMQNAHVALFLASSLVVRSIAQTVDTALDSAFHGVKQEK